MHKIYFLLAGIIISAQLLSQINFPEIEAWNKSGEIKKYDVDFLWDYINGAADYYLSYGFVELEVCEYSRSEDAYIKAEVYRHIDPINAFGIYAYERPPKAEYLEIASEAYLVHSALNFYCADFYVKIHSPLNDEETQNTIKKIAESLANTICDNTKSPALLYYLPKQNILPHTEKYFPANYLGLSFLENAVEAVYIQNEEKYKVFVIKEISPNQARESLKKYLKFAGTDTLVENNGIYHIDDMFNDQVEILIRDNFLYGVYGTQNETLANQVLQEIMEAKESE